MDAGVVQRSEGSPSKWRARSYWVLAAVVLPIVNPLLVLAGVAIVHAAFDGVALPWPVVALAVACANGLLLWAVASRTWVEAAARQLRIALGLVASIPLGFAAAVVELVIYLEYACSGSCFS